MSLLRLARLTDDTGASAGVNRQGSMLAMAVRNTTTDAPSIANPDCRGIMLILNIAASSGAGGVEMFIQNVNPTADTLAITLGSSGIFNAVGRYAMVVYPGATDAFNDVKKTINLPLAGLFTAYVQHSDASNYTYALDYCLFR
jgi:hypothetical protein